MRKSWLGAALLGAWLSATAEAQYPSPVAPPGGTPYPGSVPALTAPPGRMAGIPGVGPGMLDPAPMTMGTPMHPAMPNGMGYPGPGGPPPPQGMGYPGPGGPPPPPHGMGPTSSAPSLGDLPRYPHGGAMYGGNAWYVTLGGMTLQRERLRRPVAVRDPSGIETGIAPPISSPTAADLNDMEMDWMVGGRVAVGYHWGCHALEASGFYIPQDSSFLQVNNPRRLDAFFFNPPVGFEGNNFLWLQADQITASLRTALGNAELNYRCWVDSHQYLSFSLGVRYVDVWERLRIFTDDDGLTILDAVGRPDPRRQATYTARTHNRILAGQLGFECNLPLNPWLAATCTGKGAWGANFLETDVRLTRGDGFRGFSNGRSETIFSHLYDAGFYLDWRLHQCAKLRTGWNLLWLVHVAEAVEQIDFNLENRTGRRRTDGDILYHGPTVELHLVF